MKNAIKFTAIILFIGMVMASCGTKDNRNQDSEESNNIFPTISEQGVEPFLIRANASDIPPQGKWYDNIEIEETFDIALGSYTTTVSTEELQELQDDDAFNGILSHKYSISVLKNENCLMKIECDENRIIKEIRIVSPILKMENGIGVGMSVEEINKHAEAKLIVEDDFTIQDAKLSIEIQGVPKNIIVNLADKNNLLDRFVSFMNGDVDCENWKEHDGLGYEIPITEGFGDSVSSIVIH